MKYGVVFAVLMAVALVSVGHAAEPENLQHLLPSKVTGDGLEAWFFSFLEKLLNLFADFIGKILSQIFGGIGGLFAGDSGVHA